MNVVISLMFHRLQKSSVERRDRLVRLAVPQYSAHADHHPTRCNQHHDQVRQACTVLLPFRTTYRYHTIHQIATCG